jgi:two-component system, OmpR family, sensor histidine kinase CssS
MKNQPLAVQIWLVIAGITLGISLLFATLMPWTLQSFFTREMYSTIENSQNAKLVSGWEHGITDPVRRDEQRQNNRSVNHILLMENGLPSHSIPFPTAFKNEIKREALQQKVIVSRYSRKIEKETIFYVIRKGILDGHKVYLFSYMWGSYQTELVQTLFRRIMFIMGLVLIGSWIPSIVLAKYLSRPLVRMEKAVRKIAYRDWHEPIEVGRMDEIGSLAGSIERMREQLVKQDEAQQTFLQHISHDLKTPVMVIRSYAQSIRDGIYPKGDLSSTVQVIEDESERLEKRIRDLLYLTKLEYLASRELIRKPIAIHSLIDKTVDRFRVRRSNVIWKRDLMPLMIAGDPDQWGIVFENLFDNQLRYARERVEITLLHKREESKANANIRIWNDGPFLDPTVENTLFQEFHKGDKGEFGLGLAIVKRIVSFHKGKVWAVNENNGVAFYIVVPAIEEGEAL